MKRSAAQIIREKLNGYKSQIGDYENRIKGFNDQIANYTNQVNTLTGQYKMHLRLRISQCQARDQFESQFKQASADYEAARAEADQYREEAVGQQLRAVEVAPLLAEQISHKILLAACTSGQNRLQQ